jgi:large subunit ribosomal protein L14
MIQQQTILKVADNSGAKLVKCIKVLGGFKRKVAFLGDIVIVSVIKLRNKSKIFSKVKKGEIYKALILRTKHSVKKRGINISFDGNYVCLINKQGKPISTRIFGPIPKELKKHKWVRLSSLSSGFL